MRYAVVISQESGNLLDLWRFKLRYYCHYLSDWCIPYGGYIIRYRVGYVRRKLRKALEIQKCYQSFVSNCDGDLLSDLLQS